MFSQMREKRRKPIKQSPIFARKNVKYKINGLRLHERNFLKIMDGKSQDNAMYPSLHRYGF